MKITDNLIAGLWSDFSESAFSTNGVKPGSIQYIESRRCFYAGFAACFGCVTHDVVSGPQVPIKHGVALIQSLSRELALYADELTSMRF